MFNRLARLWGRKAGGEQDAATPVGGQIDQEARQGDKDALDRSLERYRQQSAERERQWKEAQLKAQCNGCCHQPQTVIRSGTVP